MTGDDSREALTVKSPPGKAVGAARGKPDMLRSQEAESESAGYVSHWLRTTMPCLSLGGMLEKHIV